MAGYNLPFALWTGWAVFRILFPDEGICLIRKVFSFVPSCPGCGLTGQYAAFLSGGSASPFFYAVFTLFIVNLLVSLIVVMRGSGVFREDRTDRSGGTS